MPYLLALDGAQVLINISSSPGRDIAAVVEGGLGSADSWRTLMRTYAQLTTCFVVFVNRVGVDEAVTFWGGSQVIDPAGEVRFEAPLLDEGLFVTEIDLDDVRRERVALPLLRDERPEFVLRQLERLVREQAGIASRTPARSRGVDRRRRRRHGAPYELPDELLIDTDVARQIIGEFIRGHLRADRLRADGARAVGRARLRAGGVPDRRGDRRRQPAVRAAAVSDVVARVARRRRGSRRRAGLRKSAGRHHADRRRLLRRLPRRTSAADARRRGNFAARMRMAVIYDLSVVVGRPGRRHRQQDRGAARLHDDLRRQRGGAHADRRPVQEPGPPAVGRRSACPQQILFKAPRPTCGRTRPTRASWA